MNIKLSDNQLKNIAAGGQYYGTVTSVNDKEAVITFSPIKGGDSMTVKVENPKGLTQNENVTFDIENHEPTNIQKYDPYNIGDDYRIQGVFN